jgi:hypothetical protein
MTFKTDYMMSYETASQEDRCSPRTKLRMSATLRGSGAPGFSVTVTDISIAGFSCQAVTSLPKAAICWLSLPGLAGLQAEVVWNNGIIVGCSFANLMNQAVLDSVIARYRAIA